MERLLWQIYKPKENGTHGRVWYTDEENNIAFSCFIETNCELQKIEGITLDIANILVQVFRELYGILLEIKQPNDLMYHNKKVGGILTETKVSGNHIRYMVIGIGINTNQEKFIEKLQEIASSIKLEFNITINNKKVIYRFLELLEERFIERKILK